MVGLSRGGQQVGKCKEVFGKAVKLLVDLASLQVSTPTANFLVIQTTKFCSEVSQLYLCKM